MSRVSEHPGCPEVVARLDLTRHGLLEASAGTGKTYAIEHLVLRMLLENDQLELSQILVLTFTEKAAGELKEKIRARLAWRLAQGALTPSARDRLREAHLGFDRASIHTIHGFCQRMLRNYAFENNALFRMDLVKDNREVLQQALVEEMRSTWLSEAGEGPEGLAAFRTMAGALGLGARTRWDGKLLQVAESYNPARGDVLLPECDPARVAAAEDAMLAAVEALRALFPGLASEGNTSDTSFGSDEARTFLAGYRTIRFSNTTLKKKAPQVVEAALALAAACPPDRGRVERLERCEAFLESITLTAAKQDFACLLPGPGEGDALTRPALEALEALVHALDALRGGSRARARERGALAFADQRRVILGLRKRAQAYKREKGLIGFDDMIEGVHAALRDRPGLDRALRLEYRYCLVDEFQDTDPLQWDIFRRLFLDAGGTHPLFLIGDPKQAIYRFRGGDIHTYMDARGALQDLSRKGKAQGLSLDTNYRSSAAMVEACNTLFAHPGWFHVQAVDPGDGAWKLPGAPDPLGYLPALHGGLPIQACADTTASPAPVVTRDFSGETDRAAVERKVTAWLVAEAAALLAEPDHLRIPDKTTGRLRPLAHGDICILVQKHREKTRLEKALFRAGIPFQVDKRAGLYQGDAAVQYLAVLEALEDPRDVGKQALALLTRFFRYPGDAPPMGPPAESHPWFEEWGRMAARRQWPRLFHALLYRTGLLHRESLEEDGDRRIMDFLHIAQNLAREALAEGHALPALVQRLRDLRAGTGEGDGEDDLHREESEGGKVVLMTMHSSKGLEFPVVLLASFSGPPRPGVLKYRQDGRTVFNLDAKDPAALAAYQEEAEGEERRLFYVAFTRARYKLYAPILPAKYSRSASGPLGGFAGQALKAAARSRPELIRLAAEEDSVRSSGNSNVTQASSPPREAAAPDLAPLAPAAPPATFFADAPGGDPYGGADAVFSARRRRLASYSQLARRGDTVAAEGLEGRFDKEEAPREGEGDAGEEAAAVDAGAPGNALPRGRETGNMFHEILEDLDFAAVTAAPRPEDLLADRAAANLIAGRMLEHRLAETHRGDVARVLWHALTARIPDPAVPGETFRLGDLVQRKHEMEFLFPYPPGSGTGGHGYLWGYIDLVFRRDGRFYLLDWKSNWLEDYGPASLEHSIRENRYDLQYMLYAMALDRWLAGVQPGYTFDRHFGGVLYVYLRGMRTDGPATWPSRDAGPPWAPGVFALRPNQEQVRVAYPAQVDKALGRPAADAAGAETALRAIVAETVGLDPSGKRAP